MSATRQHVIIGAGTAGISAAEAIRYACPQDSVTLFSAESEVPYSPTVLPHLLAGRINEQQIALRAKSFFDGAHCRLMSGKTATGIDAERRVVRFADGSEAQFDTLLLAAGSEPIKPAIDNRDAVQLLTFTRLADLRFLRARLSANLRVGILGAGLIGMELAEALAHLPLGIRVLVVEQEKQVLPRTFNKDLGERVLALFEERGISFQLGCRAIGIERAGNAIAVTLSDASVHTVDLMVMCVGVKPRSDFLADSGLELRRGVLVDRRMATNLPGVYAAGDLAEGPAADGTTAPNPVLPTASAQGRVAGANMAGRSSEYPGWLPANIFNFFGQVAVAVGANEAAPERQSFSQGSNGTRRELFFEDERLVGASFLGVQADPGALSWLIRRRISVKKHAELLLQRPLEASRWLASRAQREKV